MSNTKTTNRNSQELALEIRETARLFLADPLRKNLDPKEMSIILTCALALAFGTLLLRLYKRNDAIGVVKRLAQDIEQGRFGPEEN